MQQSRQTLKPASMQKRHMTSTGVPPAQLTMNLTLLLLVLQNHATRHTL